MHDATTLPSAMLMVMMEPPSDLEDEFNDWYDTEHFPQRRSLPGCIAASRWVCVHGWPRWMALYDLASVDVLRSDAYRSMSGRQSTAWTRRIMSRTVGRRRVVATALAGTTAIQHAGWETSRLVVMGIPVETHGDALDAAGGAATSTGLVERGASASRIFRITRSADARRPASKRSTGRHRMVHCRARRAHGARTPRRDAPGRSRPLPDGIQCLHAVPA